MTNIDKILKILEHDLGTFDEIDNLSPQSFDISLNYKQKDILPKTKKKRFKSKYKWRSFI